MELKTIVYDLIEDVIKEINEPENQTKIKRDIIEPFTMYVIKQMYPYLVSTCIIILLMLLCIVSVLIIVIKKL
jgi:uncharacterized membrane protein